MTTQPGRFCPIPFRTDGGYSHRVPCAEDRCAWWDTALDGCAVAAMSRSIGDLVEAVVAIAVGGDEE